MSRRTAVLIKHPAPYRDPVVYSVVKKGGVDAFAVFDKDSRHDWAEFSSGYKVLDGSRLPWRLLKNFVLSPRYSTVLWPAYHPWWLTLPIVLSAVMGKRYALTSDTKDENGGFLSRQVKRFIYRRAAFIFVPGRSAARYLTDRYRVCADRIVTGLFMVDPAEVTRGCVSRVHSRRKFLMVANDIPGRRIDVLVEGFRRWRRSGEILVLCGAGCGRHSGEGVVASEGVVWSELMNLYDAADVYVHNGMEQYSTAVQIAALRGMPIICSRDVGIVADFEDAAKDMVVVDDWRSADAWQGAFARMQAMGEEELSAMCENVRGESVGLYRVEAVSDALYDALGGEAK